MPVVVAIIKESWHPKDEYIDSHTLNELVRMIKLLIKETVIGNPMKKETFQQLAR